jgi:hypothetical protein
MVNLQSILVLTLLPIVLSGCDGLCDDFIDAERFSPWIGDIEGDGDVLWVIEAEFDNEKGTGQRFLNARDATSFEIVRSGELSMGSELIKGASTLLVTTSSTYNNARRHFSSFQPYDPQPCRAQLFRDTEAAGPILAIAKQAYLCTGIFDGNRYRMVWLENADGNLFQLRTRLIGEDGGLGEPMDLGVEDRIPELPDCSSCSSEYSLSLHTPRSGCTHREVAAPSWSSPVFTAAAARPPMAARTPRS